MEFLKCPFSKVLFSGAIIASTVLLKNKLSKKSRTVRVGAIELGGTFCSIAIVEKKYIDDKLVSTNILQQTKIDTGLPQETIKNIEQYLRQHNIDEIGIASFGPLDLNKQSSNYGSITTTPKKQWVKYSIYKELQKVFPEVKKISIDTDVNSCAMAEYLNGGHCVKNSLAYITVGTGVGVGLVINGKTVHGLLHPEGGHSIVPDLDIKGICQKHKNCVEGYVTNQSMAQQLNCQIQDLPNLSDDLKIWDQTAQCLATLCVNICLICSPEVIVIGGGVMNRKILYPKIQQKFKEILNGYIQNEILDNPQIYIREPGLQENVGLIGASILSDS